ncbi:MAG: zinc-ribbon domain-containing protein [Bacilli bacterium]|nr:zinc-ribbon domain-containing protein [Bacilli bacterium]
MYCGNCGNKNEEGALFCSNCGTKIEKLVEVKEEKKEEVKVVEPVQPVQPQPPVQPVNNNSGMPMWQKLVIVGLLLFLIFILIIIIVVVAILKPGNNPTKKRGNQADTRTVMIYIDGSNLETDAGIVTSELNAIKPETIDLDKVNILLYTGGTSKWHNFIKNNENAIYKLTKDGFEKVETYQKKNMGDPSTLSEFLNYAYDNYSAGHYNLVLYNHGGAIDGAIYDDFTRDNLTLEDFHKALKDSRFNENNKMDAVIFRTCLNGTLEVASVFDDYADYIVFSEEITLGSGMSNVLGYFLNGIDSTSDGAKIGEKFIDGYNKQMEDIDILGTQAVTYSIIDLSKVKPLINKLDSYMTTIDLKNNYKEISTIRNGLYQYGKVEPSYDTIDLKEFIKEVKPYATGDADDLIKSIDEAIVKNNTNLSKSHGLSVYFPYNGKAQIIQRFINVYNKLEFSKNYQSFISSFITAKGQTSSFNYNLTTNESTVTNDKEVTLQLTDEQKSNIVRSAYYVFRREEEKDRKQYYQMVYASNNSTIDNGVVSTHFNNKLVTIREEGDTEYQYICVIDEINDNNSKKSVGATIIDTDEDVLSDSRRVSADLLIEDHDGTPKFGKMELMSRDERVQGVLYDTSKYEKIQIMKTSPKVLDDKGKVMDNSKWTFPKVRYGFEGSLDKIKLEYTGLDDGEFYVLFFLFDYNGNRYLSDLIKVGE